MKGKILEVYPWAKVGRTSSAVLYVADFTERTGNNRGVEIWDTVPAAPDGSGDMDCLTIDNPRNLSLDYHILDDHELKDERDMDVRHCECCVFPAESKKTGYVAFIEIKDCKPKNISFHKAKAKEQLISCVQKFKDSKILGRQHIYGIIAFPRRKKVDFNRTLFENPMEYKAFYKKHGIHLYAANAVVVDENTVRCKKNQ